MQSIQKRHHSAVTLAAAVSLTVLAFSIQCHTGHVAIIRKAAGIGETAEGLEGFVNTCNALVTPLLVAAASAMPLAVIGGGVAMAFGSRKGLQIILTALGMLAVLGSVTGIVK